MKKTAIILAGAGLLALAACSRENQIEQTDSSKTYLTVQFGVSSPRTKTDNSGSQLDGTVAESEISEAVVYLVQSSQVKAILSVNLLNKVAHSGYDDGYESSVLVTTAALGTYELYAYAGTSTDPFGYSIGDTWQGATPQTFDPANRLGILNAGNTAALDKSFRMFSQHDASTTGSTIPTVTLTAANNTTANPAIGETIYLDRITAKVTASEDPSLSVGANIANGVFSSATATVEGIYPMAAAKTIYIQQQWSDPGMTELSTPTTDRYGFVNNSFTSGTETSYAYIEKSGGTYSSVSVGDVSSRMISVGDPCYLLENAAEPTPIWGTTSGVIFKVTLDAGGSGTPSTFFGYNNNSSHFLTLDALQAAYPNAFDVFNHKLPDGVTDDDAANLLAAKNLLATNVAQFRAQTKVNVFEDGVMYYTYFIKDNNYNTYGIFRNTWYQLLVTEVTNFGDDIPGGWVPDDPTVNPDPTTPVDDDKLYLRVKLLVNKWVANVTNVHLGE